MTALSFGAGTLIARRTDISNPTPAFMGILQSVDVEFSQTLKELMGQYKVASDIAPAELKITFKVKQARIQASAINDLLFGQTLTTASGLALTTAETLTPTGTSPVIATVANAATFQADLGIFYAANGVQLTRVAAGSEVAGKYSVNEGTGVYAFVAADKVPILFYYRYSVTTRNQISLTNVLMGQGPAFELNLSNTYTNNAGVANTVFLKLNACRSSKLSMPFKNTDYMIPEFDGQAFADQANNIGTWASTE